MTNKDDIVIRRYELPFVNLEGDGSGRRMHTRSGNLGRYEITHENAKNTREWALSYLAISEAIESLLAEDKRNLGAEARKLYEASRLRMDTQGLTCPAWEKLDANNVTHWEHIARAARELHGK